MTAAFRTCVLLRRCFDGRRQRGQTFDAHFESGLHVMMQAQFDFVLTERADRMLQMNLALVERYLELRAVAGFAAGQV